MYYLGNCLPKQRPFISLSGHVFERDLWQSLQTHCFVEFQMLISTFWWSASFSLFYNTYIYYFVYNIQKKFQLI
ncbi:hypothetical protein BpHYR1_031398 [Brachionus plicatilis]|uniref:Uncharacterized protein n=1 Tax=Brachionus plicatilis TaxID=10195 RepID=A0A3M7RVT7_BRAPC|nr:hypothetical protein BpHYR1_031398 [Brachionus plicatilis]